MPRDYQQIQFGRNSEALCPTCEAYLGPHSEVIMTGDPSEYSDAYYCDRECASADEDEEPDFYYPPEGDEG